MSPADFSREVKVSTGRASEWLNGKRIPSPKSCKKIATALRVDEEEVLEMAGHKSPSSEFEPGDPRRTAIALIKTLDPADPLDRFFLDGIPDAVERLRLAEREEEESQ